MAGDFGEVGVELVALDFGEVGVELVALDTATDHAVNRLHNIQHELNTCIVCSSLV